MPFNPPSSLINSLACILFFGQNYFQLTVIENSKQCTFLPSMLTDINLSDCHATVKFSGLDHVLKSLAFCPNELKLLKFYIQAQLPFSTNLFVSAGPWLSFFCLLFNLYSRRFQCFKWQESLFHVFLIIRLFYI